MGLDCREGGPEELVHAFAADAGKAVDAACMAAGLDGAGQGAGLALHLLGRERVDLVEADDLGLGSEGGAIGGELGADGAISLSQLLRRAIDEVDQHAAALHMAEEAVTEAGTFMGALDE